MSLFEYNEEEELRKRDQVTFEEGWKQGYEIGLRLGRGLVEQAILLGTDQGIRQGAERGISVAVDIYKTRGISFQEAVTHIAEAFSFSLPEVEQEVKKYW